jgi:twitching motility protein PilT
MHKHAKSTVNQREIGADTRAFSLALRAALRQAPKVILIGEMRDVETIEIAMEAAETGHLVLSTLHTIDAAKTVDRIVGVFPKDQERQIRNLAYATNPTNLALRLDDAPEAETAPAEGESMLSLLEEP